jgi:hypothetical protein
MNSSHSEAKQAGGGLEFPHAVVAWASDDLLRQLLEQAGWTVRIVAERDGQQVEQETMRDLFLALNGNADT